MFVTNWISTTKIQKISEITNFFRHYFLSRTEVVTSLFLMFSDVSRYFFPFFSGFQAKKILETTYDNVTNPFTMVGWGLQIPRFYRSNIFP